MAMSEDMYCPMTGNAMLAALDFAHWLSGKVLLSQHPAVASPMINHYTLEHLQRKRVHSTTVSMLSKISMTITI